MKVRGRRECKACGSRWSYYETGSVTCPECGSMRSVGVDERTEHTDAPVALDLTPVRDRVDRDPLSEVANAAAETAAEYVRKRGFIDAGDLRLLDETFVAATELRFLAAELAREVRPTEREELYFLELLRGADSGERPPPDEVPDAFREPYGLAMATGVADYQRDLRRYLDDHPDGEARSFTGRIRDQRKRIEALDGDVDPKDAHRLVRATRDLGKYVRTGEESNLVTADNWLQGIDT